MTGLRLLGALVTIELAGWAALALIRRAGGSQGRLEGLALAWGLGCSVISLGLFGALALGLGLPLAVVLVAAVGLGLFIIGIRAWPGAFSSGLREQSPAGYFSPEGASLSQRGARSPAASGSWLTLILVALLVLEIAWATLVGVARPLTDWDSWVTWGMKARAIFVDGGLVPARYFDPSRSVTNPDYPLLVPLDEAWLYQWLGQADDQAAVFLFPPFYIALLVVFYFATRRFASRNASLGFTLLVASTPRLERLASAAYADVPLAFFALITFIYLLRWMEARRPGDLWVAGIFGGLMGWTKNEGLLWLALAFLALVAWAIVRIARGTEPRRPLVLAILGFAGLSALAVVPWLAYRAIHHVGSYVFLPPTPALLWANIGRLPVVARIALARMVSPYWNFVWPLGAAAILLSWRRLRAPTRVRAQHAVPLLLWAIGGYLLLTGFSYVFSSFVPFTDHVRNSIERLMTQVLPLAWLWLARALTPGPSPALRERGGVTLVPFALSPEASGEGDRG